jgi:hypothetical protein
MGHLRDRNAAENGRLGIWGICVSDGDDPTADTTPQFEVAPIFNRDRPESRNRPPDISGSKMLKSRPLSLAGRAGFPPDTPGELLPATRFRP